MRTIGCSTRNQGRCDHDSGDAPVLMMQSAEVREGDDRSQARLLDRSWFWTLFVQRKMRSCLVIVRIVGAKSAFQVLLVEDDDVIDALSTYRSGESFNVWILPR